MRFLRTRLARFGRDEKGQLAIEAAMMLPLITWIYVSTFTYFETYRADSTNIKAAYAVGDMLSRETNPVDQTYVDGMNAVFRYMVLSREETEIRVSNVTYEANGNKFKLNWSHASGSGKPAKLNEIEDKIPMMADGDTVIVVETYMPYTPAYNIGLKPFTIRNVVVTRPRFAPQLLWAGT